MARSSIALLVVVCACSGTVSTDGDFDAAAPGTPDAAPGQPDAAAPGTPDAAPGQPDATPQPPPDFWDATGIPPAQNVMMFKFLNRTNGKLDDAHVFWRFDSGNIHELHSIAEKPFYDMPANSSGRMYFYLCPADEGAGCVANPAGSRYFDFIEHTIGTNVYNGNTTRVDAFGIKLALLLHCDDGFEEFVGEDFATFAEDRAATFQRFIEEVPAEFDHLAQPPFAPYRIVQPGAGQFGANGMYAHYYDSWVNQLWSANGITVAKPGPNGDGLGAYPDLSAAVYRHVGGTPGTFDAGGHLTGAGASLWANESSFYPAAPADYYAKFWHDHGFHKRAYGFPYDDVGSYSTYISHQNPTYLLVAIGW